MNLPSLLATCPDYDKMTRYLSAWAKKLLDEVKAKGQEVYALEEQSVDRKHFEGMVRKNKPDIVFINGHGNSSQVAGHENEVILDAASAKLLVNTVIYAVSCQSAKQLGQDLVAAGADGYIGYTEDFILVRQPQMMRRPLEDTTAALFMEPSNHIVRSLAKGHTIEEAVTKGKQEYTKSIRAALKSDVQSDDDKYVSFLLWDRQWLKGWSKSN